MSLFAPLPGRSAAEGDSYRHNAPRDFWSKVLAAARALVQSWVAPLTALARMDLRRRLSEAVVTTCVFGGFVAAPLLSLLAWVGLLLPARAPLHHAAPPLFVAALVWLILAIAGAHLHDAGRKRREHTHG